MFTGLPGHEYQIHTNSLHALRFMQGELLSGQQVHRGQVLIKVGKKKVERWKNSLDN